MNSFRTYFFLVAFQIVVSIGSFGECVLGVYAFRGLIQDKITSKPIPDARIFLFVDSSEIPFSSKPNFPSVYSSELDGTFQASILFDTFSGSSFFSRHKCSYRPERVTIVFYKDGYVPFRKEMKFERDSKEEQVFSVGTIRLQPSTLH